jgi:hypothetical protein
MADGIESDTPGRVAESPSEGRSRTEPGPATIPPNPSIIDSRPSAGFCTLTAGAEGIGIGSPGRSDNIPRELGAAGRLPSPPNTFETIPPSGFGKAVSPGRGGPAADSVTAGIPGGINEAPIDGTTRMLSKPPNKSDTMSPSGFCRPLAAGAGIKPVKGVDTAGTWRIDEAPNTGSDGSAITLPTPPNKPDTRPPSGF